MLSSRNYLCFNREVPAERDWKLVDMRWHNLTAPHVREKSVEDSQVSICSF